MNNKSIEFSIDIDLIALSDKEKLEIQSLFYDSIISQKTIDFKKMDEILKLSHRVYKARSIEFPRPVKTEEREIPDFESIKINIQG